MSVLEENQIITTISQEDTNQEDINLINNIIKTKDKASENRLYDKYNKIITIFINKNYFNNFNSEDDVSEILIKIFNNLTKFDQTQSKFITYCYNIAKNYMIDKFRKNVIPTVELMTYHENQTQEYIDTRFEVNNTLDFLSKTIKSEDYNLLKLKIEGYKSEEIGVNYGVSANTVNNRINYAKTKLRKNNKKIN